MPIKIQDLQPKIQNFKNSLTLGLRSIAERKKAKGAISINFSRSLLSIVYFEFKGKGLTIFDYDLKRIRSIEEDKKEIIKWLDTFLKKNSTSAQKVYITISNPDSIVIKHLSLPPLPKNEILKAAKWQLKDELSFDIEEAIIDWQIVREYSDEGSVKKNNVAFALIEAKVANSYTSLISKCNLTPVALLSSPFNYSTVLTYFKPDNKVQAILDISREETLLCIYKGANLSFIRKLPFSFQKLAQSLTEVLVSEQGKIELSLKEAEDVTEFYGIPQDSNQILKNNIRAIQIISLMRPLLECLVRDIQYSFDYFVSTFDEESPRAIYLTGEGGGLKNLPQYLAKELKIKVSALSIPECIDLGKLDKQKVKKDQGQIINALVAPLAGSEAINLLPQEFKTQKIETIQKIFLRVATVTALAIFLFSLFATNFQRRNYQKRLANALSHRQIITEVRTLKEKINEREALARRIQAQKVPLSGLLKVLSTVIPSNVVLDQLWLDQSKHILNLKGVVSANERIAETVLTEFMRNLEESAFFTEATLLSFQEVAEEQRFEIQCDLIK